MEEDSEDEGFEDRPLMLKAREPTAVELVVELVVGHRMSLDMTTVQKHRHTSWPRCQDPLEKAMRPTPSCREIQPWLTRLSCFPMFSF